MWHGVTCAIIKFPLLLPALLFKNHSSVPAWSTPAARALLLLPCARRWREPQQIPFTGQTEASCTTGKPAAWPNVGRSGWFPASTSPSVPPCRDTTRPSFAAGPRCRGGTTGSKAAKPHLGAQPKWAWLGHLPCLPPHLQAALFCPGIYWVLLFSRTSNSTLQEGLDIFAFHYCDRSLLSEMPWNKVQITKYIPTSRPCEDQALFEVAVLWPRKWVALVKINSWWRKNEWHDVKESSLIHFNIL